MMISKKIGMITYELEEDYNQIHTFTNGWCAAKITDEQIEMFKAGTLDMSELNWE